MALPPAWPMRLGRLAKPAIMGISCLMVLRVRNVQGTGGFAEPAVTET
jgi:hypothetical protein